MKKAQVLWLIFGAVALLFLIGAATVQPGRPISQYPRVTVLQGTDIFPIARTNVTPATNMGVTGFVISNYVVSIATGAVEIVAGTNVIITSTTNSTGGQTHTIAVTNTGSGVADGVWTNNAGVIHPKVSNGQQTNSIQIYTNGAMAVGLGTLSYWSVPVAGETLVSLRDTNFGDLAWNESFLGVKTGTNLFWQDHFMAPTINRRTYAMEQFGTTLKIDEYVDVNSNFVYRAFNSNGFDMWHFSATGAGASNDTRYTFNSYGPVDSSDLLFLLQNDATNKFEVYGGAGNVNINGQITNQFLSASKLVKTDANKGLVSSTLDETGITNLITELATNNVKVTAGTNIVVITNVSGNTITYQVNNGLDTNIFASTSYVATILMSNFMSLSVQAGKPIDTTNFPAVGSGYKNWELLYYKTNVLGTIAPLSANWQFIVPRDYLTNSLSVYVTSMLIDTTNGPATSNTILRASIFKSTPGDAVDVHQDAFGAKVPGTNDWAASNTGTNKTQSMLIEMSTNALIQAGDLAILNLERNSTNDTYGHTLGVTGLQLWYKRQ